MKKLIALLGLVAFLSSCEKVVDVDLNSADPQTVFEGNLKEGADTVWFYMSQTADYFGNGEPSKLDGAQIEFTDADGNIFAAQSVGDGAYFVSGINSSIGANYTVKVDYDGFTTMGESFMPQPVPLDSINFEYQPANDFVDESYLINIAFQDPGNLINYYQLILRVNGERQGDITVFDDRLNQGTYIKIPLFGYEIANGDIVEVELQSIDEGVYNYLLTLASILSQNGPPGIAPANPITNLDGEIQLGYFGTYSASAITDTVR